MSKKLTITFLFSIVNFLCFGQSEVADLFNAKNYLQCIKECNTILSENSDDLLANYYKGASLLKQDNYIEALISLKKAKSLNYRPLNQINVDIILAQASLNDKAGVLETLDQLDKNNFNNYSFLEQDQFIFLNNDPEFLASKESIYKKAFPCKYNKKFKKLDFWIGEWDVYVNEIKTANSKITKSKGGCSLHEDYQTLSGFYGSSISYFSPIDSIYKQTWIDKFGGVAYFKEIDSNDNYLSMTLENARSTFTRMNYQYDEEVDEVIQTMESSNDSGKTWVKTFEGVYKRKQEKS